MGDISDPSTWTAWLKTIHESRDEPTTVSAELIDKMEHSDTDTWTILWKAGFPRQAAENLLDQYFCGYSREDLVSSRGREIQVHVSFRVESLRRAF